MKELEFKRKNRKKGNKQKITLKEGCYKNRFSNNLRKEIRKVKMLKEE
jgi:hypothetical protein